MAGVSSFILIYFSVLWGGAVMVRGRETGRREKGEVGGGTI